MKILLVVSQSDKTKSAVRLIYPPLNLQQIAALTPPEHNVDVIDEGFSSLDLKKNYDYDLVGISCNTRNAFRAYDIADHFRGQGKKVISRLSNKFPVANMALRNG